MDGAAKELGRCDSAGPKQIIHVTLTDKLKQRRHQARKHLADLDNAITAVEANPGIQEALDAISRVEGHGPY